jgi:hypothetical protein
MRRKVGILEEQPVASTSGKVRGRPSAAPPQLVVEPRTVLSGGDHACISSAVPPPKACLRAAARDSATSAAGPQEMCQICFDEFQARDMRSACCEHLFCQECWRGYVANAINSGPSSLNLRCPLPNCSAAVRSPLSSPEGLVRSSLLSIRCRLDIRKRGCCACYHCSLGRPQRGSTLPHTAHPAVPSSLFRTCPLRSSARQPAGNLWTRSRARLPAPLQPGTARTHVRDSRWGPASAGADDGDRGRRRPRRPAALPAVRAAELRGGQPQAHLVRALAPLARACARDAA